MKMLFDSNILPNINPSTKLPLECNYCKNTFYKKAVEILKELRRNARNLGFCNRFCFTRHQQNRFKTICANCGKESFKTLTYISRSKSGNSFCSKSCGAIYNNAHKITGTRRSKLEQWIEDKLIADYPDLEVSFNKKDVINSELDIYFPKIKLAVELNGIFHYEPIYGAEKLTSIQNNDNRKFQACIDHGIELIIINTSQMKNITQVEAKKYYRIIENILTQKLADENYKYKTD